ncbi:Putative Zn-dependent protease aq_972 [hydrothermal vent metagenome]|uniref:Zn-dependent protease aq_972 n=1 Tax=hydrothermal vent metagenome TaxID=652676 RepID=A0A3B1AQ33_9ZZZZ
MQRKIKLLQSLILAVGVSLLSACAVNPVTGKDELALFSESWELETGREQYSPSRQMQGGDYDLDPGLSRYVNEVGQRLAAASDRKLPYEFEVINDSSPNAWALPGGKIAINRGLLLELETEAELAAVLSHEIVHTAARHGAKGMERGMLLQGVVLAAGMASSNSDYSRVAVGAAAVGANLVNQRYSRGAETESDYYGMVYMVRAGYNPQAAVKLQETFVRLSKEKKQDWLSGLFVSHPPSKERVRRNREAVQKLGAKGGEWGRERYQRVMANLHRSKPAYDALDEGLKALQDGDERQALKLAGKAISIEPKEALFYSLRGDIFYKQKRYQQALKDYNQALDHNDGYFRYYLERGVTREKLRDQQGARQDLKKSIKLLPTAIAFNALGRLALVSGNRRQAKKYFGQAAGSKSPDGIAAARELVRLDISDNPRRYFKVNLEALRNGDVVALIHNGTKERLRNVRFAVGQRSGGGRLLNPDTHYIRGVMLPGETVQIRTGIRGLANKGQLQQYGVMVVGAEIAK